jgi:hypothetical protein
MKLTAVTENQILFTAVLKVTDMWLTVLLHTWEAPGANPCPETKYSDKDFACSFSVPPANASIVSKNGS